MFFVGIKGGRTAVSVDFMLPSTSRPPVAGLSSALVLLIFAGGSVLDAILRAIYHYSPAPGQLPVLLLAAVPVFIAAGLWICLRGIKSLAGTSLLQLLLAAAVGVVTMASTLPLSWYLGIGLVLWAMRLRHNVLTWVGTSLLVLAAGAQLEMISFSGVLFLPFVLTPPVFLGAAAYYQLHQVRHTQVEADFESEQSIELHRNRYGREPGH